MAEELKQNETKQNRECLSETLLMSLNGSGDGVFQCLHLVEMVNTASRSDTDQLLRMKTDATVKLTIIG